MEITQKYSNEGIILQNHRIPNFTPTIDAIVTNVDSGKSTLVTERFIIDSGASMTILGPKLEHLFLDTIRIDVFNVAYGAGTKKLDVFKIKMLVHGLEFELLAALDTGLKIKHHLLGITKGFDFFDHLVLNNKLKTTKLIKKY